MKSRRLLSFNIIVLLIFVLVTQSWSGKEKQESILDKKLFIENKLITKIPFVKRWCERLPLKKHKIDMGDAELYVEEEGEGVPIVLINGGPGGTHHYFHPWFSKAASFARIIYYDQRGCGLSDRKPGKDGYSVAQAVEDLDKIRKALKIKKWVVLGYSYGGFLAQLYCLTYPENLEGMILLGSSPGYSMDSGQSRQYDFITKEERNRIKEIQKELSKLYSDKKIDRKKYIQILLYNNFLNGDWKRQQFYKPSRERLSEIALYEWDHDRGFNGKLGGSQSCYDLNKVFRNNPVPTLMLEGKWDLTWGSKKAQLFKMNHPNAQMKVFNHSGHGIYDEEPLKFINTIKSFVKNLPKTKKTDIKNFKLSLRDWEQKVEKAKEAYAFLQKYNWGLQSSKELVKDYNEGWLRLYGVRATNVLRIGFAFYDVRKFEKSYEIFCYLEKTAKKESYKIAAMIWQAHMLDLLKKRSEAIKLYKKVVKINSDDGLKHGQYKLTYKFTPYAKKRLKEPFKFIPNS